MKLNLRTVLTLTVIILASIHIAKLSAEGPNEKQQQPHPQPQQPPHPQPQQQQPHPQLQQQQHPQPQQQQHPQPQHQQQPQQQLHERQSQLSNSQFINTARTPSLSHSDRKTSQHPFTFQSLQAKIKNRNQQSPQNSLQSKYSESHDQVKQYLNAAKQSRVGKQISTQKQEDIKANLIERKQSDNKLLKEVHDRVEINHPGYGHWFSKQFFEQHHYNHEDNYHGDNRWGRGSWMTINNWLGWDWYNPIFYYEGYPVDLPTDVEGNYDEAEPSPEIAVQGDWLPIGIFAISTATIQASLTDMFIQLVINKEGYLEGTYYNAITDQIYPLKGSVDKESQQAAWQISEKPDSPIMTTGIYDLSQDIVPMQILFEDGTEQSWILIRLSAPQSS